MSTSAISFLIASWLFYFGLHSLLASLSFKKMIAELFPNVMPAYRLTFNIIAVLSLIPPIGLLYLAHADHGEPLWQWQGILAWIANGLALAALALFVSSLRFYDTAEFSGLRQLRNNIQSVEDQEKFCLSPLHRFVRHPWYFLALVLIWTREMDQATAISAALISGYFIIGSRLEEQKLMVYHGELYQRYCAKVPALFPLPWRYLKKIEVAELLEKKP